MTSASMVGGALVAACLAFVLHGADPAGAEGLRLTDAIDRALAKSPLLDAAGRDRARAAAGMDRARAAFLPRLEASYGYARGDQPTFAFGSKLNQGRFEESDFDVGRLNSPGAVDNYRSAVTLHQPVYTGGRATLGLERAQIGRQIAELESARTTQEVVFQVARAYFTLRLAQERLQAVDASVKAAEANLALARSRFRAGLAVESDVLSAEVRLARLQEDFLTARSQQRVAQAVLNDAMGAPLDEPVEAVDPFTLPARADGDIPGDVLGARPDYQALRLQEETRDRELRLARAEFFPTVGLEGTYEVNTAQPLSDGQGSWSVGAVLRWNFFSGGADLARVREAEATLGRARAVTARAASLIGLEVREAHARLVTARERAAVAERAIAQAEESLRVVRLRYQGGLTTIVDLLSAEAAFTESRQRRLEALHDVNLGVAAWELALGRLDRATFR